MASHCPARPARHPDHQLGITYYAVPVLNARIAGGIDWSTAAATGVFLVALIASRFGPPLPTFEGRANSRIRSSRTH